MSSSSDRTLHDSRGHALDKWREDLVALVDTLFPADADCPSASDIGVVDYIERQLVNDWGEGGRMYREPPFVVPDHAGHGWQWALTPSDAYSDGLRALDSYVTEVFGSAFHALSEAQRGEVVERMRLDEIPTFTRFPSSEFFGLLRQNLLEGLFADPRYGGNRELAGWRWIGYPGIASAHGDDYSHFVDKFDHTYVAEPSGLDTE